MLGRRRRRWANIGSMYCVLIEKGYWIVINTVARIQLRIQCITNVGVGPM